MPTESLSNFAGPTGVGALCILGVFLALDGQAPNLFPTVETYAKTNTWGIVAAVPVLVIAYIVGVFVTSGAELLLQQTIGLTFETEAADLAVLGKIEIEKSALVKAYVQLRLDRSILAGSSIALLLVVVGAISEINNLRSLKGPILSLVGVTLLLSILTFYFAARKGREAHLLAQQYAQMGAQSLTQGASSEKPHGTGKSKGQPMRQRKR